MKKTIATALIALAMAHPATAQQIAKYRPGTATPGAVYMLPKTALRFTVRAERTTYTPGQFARYAKRYMKLDNVPQQPSEKWRVLTIDMLATAVPDTAKCYRVAINPKTSAPNFALSDDGILLGINADVQQKPLPEPFKPAPKPAQKDPRQYLNEDVLVAASTAKQAELTAQDIYDLRDNRNLLTRGQADFMPKDGEQLKLMLAGLDTSEAALMQCFVGTRKQERHTFVLSFTPTSAPQQQAVLFRFSSFDGVVDVDDVSGEPFVITVQQTEKFTEPSAEELGKAKPGKPLNDVRYRLPLRAHISVASQLRPDEQLATLTAPLAQLGRIEVLGGELFQSKRTTKVYLSPQTGAVLRIEE